MDGISRPIGAGVPIHFNGKDYVLPPMKLRDFGVVEQHLLSKRPNLVALTLQACREQNLSESATDLLVERAMRMASKANRISSEEVKEWLDTREGVAFTLWHCLEKTYPGQISLEDANDILQKMAEDNFADLLDKRDRSSGMDTLGNSTGSTPSAIAEPGKMDAHETIQNVAIGGNGGQPSSKRNGSRKKSRS